MRKKDPEHEEARPDSHDSSGFPASARPIVRTISFLILALALICLITAKACGSASVKPPPPSPEKIKNIIQPF